MLRSPSLLCQSSLPQTIADKYDYRRHLRMGNLNLQNNVIAKGAQAWVSLWAARSALGPVN